MIRLYCLCVFLLCLNPFSAVAKDLRLVVLNGDALEVLRSLDASEMVVGIGNTVAKNPGFWGELAQLPVVGAWNSANLERIAELHSDAVITYRKTPGPELEARLAALGIEVWRYDFFHHASFVEEIRSLAARLERRQQGEVLLDWWQQLDAKLRQRLTQVKEKPLVYVEGYGIWRGSGPGSGIDAMLSLAGGRNLMADAGTPYPEISPELVFARAPQWILKTASVHDCYAQDCLPQLQQVAAEMTTRPALAATPAVQNQRLLILGSDLGPGPRGIIGILELARRLHPDLFAELDPQAWHGGYLQRFQHLPLKGTYIWSPGDAQ